MVWARLDDAILDNPKVAAAGVFGFAMHVAGITWCCRNLTDGFIPHGRVTALVTLTNVHYDAANPLALPGGPESNSGGIGLDPYLVVRRLVSVGLWETADGGFQVHDFLNYNPSKEKVLAERDASRRRQSRHRHKQSSSVTNAGGNGVTDGPVTDVPVPVPVPLSDQQPSIPSSKVKPKKKRVKKTETGAHLCPKGFSPPPKLYDWARDEFGFSRIKVDFETSKMRDWSRSNNKRKADWVATLRNWLRPKDAPDGQGSLGLPEPTSRSASSALPPTKGGAGGP